MQQARHRAGRRSQSWPRSWSAALAARSSGRVGDPMGHGRATFKETDLTRALRAARKAGADVERVEVGRDGRIVLVLKDGEKVFTERNEWDE
jgi:hypothetical protein